jgi:hypothetical protein
MAQLRHMKQQYSSYMNRDNVSTMARARTEPGFICVADVSHCTHQSIDNICDYDASSHEL